MQNFEKRLQALEAAVAGITEQPPPLLILTYNCGMTPEEVLPITQLTCGGTTYQREEGEPWPDFQQRAIRETLLQPGGCPVLIADGNDC